MAIPKEKTELENYLVYGVDLKNRRIFFGVPLDWGVDENGGFEQASTELTIRAIKRMEKDHPSKPIELHMNSYGGDAYALTSVVDVILASKCQFKFYGSGAIMSAATWIMAVCDERYLYPNATVMVHNGWDKAEGKHDDVIISAAEAERLRIKLTEIYVKNSFMPKKFWDDVLQRDLYMPPEEAIKIGIADFIIEPTKRGNLRKRRDTHMANPPHHRTMKKLVDKLYKRININFSGELKIHIPEPAEADPSVIIDDTPVVEPGDVKKEDTENKGE